MPRLHALLFSTLFLSPALLFSQIDDSWQVYDDSSLARIEVTIAPDDLSWILAHAESDSEFLASCHFQNRLIDEQVDSIGFRLRGNTSRESAKKSFKISFNTFIRGRQFHGLDKLNLNGEHNDPSIIRSKLCFDLYRDIGRVASRASHARLYINNRYQGLYISVEHIDDEFLSKRFSDDSGPLWKCLYPADLTYKGNNPQLYAALTDNGRPVYELTANETTTDFQPLARLIRVLNLTSTALPDSLETLLDVPGVLQYLAINTLVGSWDDYRSLMNNYYLYYEPSTARFTLIPYDYDNTFGVDWFGIDWSAADPYNFPKIASGSRPLAERLLAYGPWRDLYTHFLHFYRTRVFDLARQEARIDRQQALTRTAALEDDFRTLDYRFTAEDWSNSYTAGSYSNQHVKFGLKAFINRRSASLPGQLRYTGAGPIVYRLAVVPPVPAAGDSIPIEAACFAGAGLAQATLLFTPAGAAAPQLYPMQRRPLPGTTRVEEADRWIGVLPPLTAGSGGSLRIRLLDSLQVERIYPLGRPVQLQAPGGAVSGVRLNEFMAENSRAAADPAGEYDDWIELYNPGPEALSLDGLYLSDKRDRLTKWRISQGGMVAPGGCLIIWCDEQTEQGPLHTNFKLSTGGEFIALTGSDGVTVLDSLSFGPQSRDLALGRWPDGSGGWQRMTPSPGAPNQAPLAVHQQAALPRRFSLQAWPNPFNAQTRIAFDLPQAGRVTLQLYNLIGQQVRLLLDQRMDAGLHTLTLNASGLPAGLYFCRLQADARIATLKLLLVN